MAEIGHGDAGERLPWLESAEPEPAPARPIWRNVLIVLAALLVIGAAVFAFLRLDRSGGVEGSGGLIEAQGPYKVRPGEPGGMRVEGEGDTVFATSEGGTSNASVDVGAVPETPVARTVVRPTATPSAAASGTRVVTQVPAAQGRLQARAPARPAAPVTTTAGGGSAVVQLGSFPTEGGANRAWERLSGRFAYLAPLGKSVQPAEVNGATTYRLRVNTGSATQASDLCGRLKVAGEACFIAR